MSEKGKGFIECPKGVDKNRLKELLSKLGLSILKSEGEMIEVEGGKTNIGRAKTALSSVYFLSLLKKPKSGESGLSF